MLTRRARIPALLLAALIPLASLVGAAPAMASSPQRFAGDNRYATAVRVSQEFASGVPVVYIATGTNYPDALSAAPAAAHQGGPLLLTPRDSLPSSVSNEIARLAPSLIVVVGGAAAVSDAVVSQLSSFATVRRDGGANRYETSRIINENAFASGASSAFVATGLNFPDALSASAAAGSLGSPVVLVNGAASSVDSDTTALLTSLGVSQIYIAGGTAVVSPSLTTSLGGVSGVTGVTRLAGDERYATSTAINVAFFSSAPRVYFAVGTGFADALAGAALAGAQGAPLFVVPGNCVPTSVLNAMSSMGTSTHVLLGGTSVLTSDVENLLDCANVPPPVVDPPVPGNPGNSKNCPDFSTQAEAQAWFMTYYPYYGDVAQLDADHDMIACETLP